MRSVSELHGWPPSKILWAAGHCFLEATVCCLHVLVGALSRRGCSSTLWLCGRDVEHLLFAFLLGHVRGCT